MRHILKSLGVVALIGLFACAAHAEEQILQYEPSVVGLTGVIRMERHYGPPSFGASPKTDLVETVPILLLDKPVTVQGNPRSPAEAEAFSHVTRVQLVVAGPGRNDLTRFLGKHIVATGRLFEKVSGENFTDVLLDVRQIGPAAGAAR
ncbi:MAG TPA: DUF4431 domain-containing protein [Acetobacteraceae bacterium]|nr:DUF4431 domain-containing protein [Acetobacteraceae bacterium]